MNEAATHASVNVSGTNFLFRLEHVNGQHNQLANGVANGVANGNARMSVKNQEGAGNEYENDCGRMLWKAESGSESENGHGYEQLLAQASESDCGHLGKLSELDWK